MTNLDINSLNADQINALIAAHMKNEQAKKDRGAKMIAEIDAEITRIETALTYARTLRANIAEQIGQPVVTNQPTSGRKSGGSGTMLEIDGKVYNSPTAAAKMMTGTSAEIDGVRWFGLTGTEADGQIIERKYCPRGGQERIIRAIVRKPGK